MFKATIVYRSQISGEHTTEIHDEDITLFYAQVVGAVQGITAAGSVVVSVVTSKED